MEDGRRYITHVCKRSDQDSSQWGNALLKLYSFVRLTWVSGASRPVRIMILHCFNTRYVSRGDIHRPKVRTNTGDYFCVYVTWHGSLLAVLKSGIKIISSNVSHSYFSSEFPSKIDLVIISIIAFWLIWKLYIIFNAMFPLRFHNTCCLVNKCHF